MCCTTWVWFLDSGQPNSHSTRLSGLLGTWNCAGQFHKTCSFEPCWWWQNGQRPFERPRVMTENLIGLTNAPVKQATSCMLPKDARNRATRHRVASYSSWRKFWESRRFCCVKKVHCFRRQLSRRWWRISSQLATRCALLRSIATLRASWCHRKGAWTTQSNFFRKSLTRRVTPPAKVQSRGRLRTRWMCLNNAETAFWPAMNSRSTWCPHNSLHRYTEACWWPYPALRVRDTNFVHHLTGGARRIQPKDALPVITWLANLCFPLELKGSARTRSADFTALSNLLTSLGLGAEPLWLPLFFRWLVVGFVTSQQNHVADELQWTTPILPKCQDPCFKLVLIWQMWIFLETILEHPANTKDDQFGDLDVVILSSKLPQCRVFGTYNPDPMNSPLFGKNKTSSRRRRRLLKNSCASCTAKGTRLCQKQRRLQAGNLGSIP